MKEMDNIIKFPNKSVNKSKSLSDNDINNLFLGLVKLVKSNIEQQFCENNKLIEKDYRKALILIADKDMEIEKLINKNKIVNDKVKSLEEKLQEIRSLNLKNLEVE